MVSKRYRDIINTMREKWILNETVPVCFPDDVWDQWVAWWNSPEFLKISNRNKRNRSSKGGKACVYTGGSVSVVDLLDRMQKVYGMHIDITDVFAAMHTKKNDAGELVWISNEAQRIFEFYIEIVHEKAVAEGLIDNLDSPVTRLPFEPDSWKAAVTKYYISEGKRAKRGDRLFGLGEQGAALINLSSNTSHSSSFYEAPPPVSSDPDPEKEELKTEVSNLKKIVMKLMEQQEEQQRRQQQEEQQRKQREEQQRQQVFQQIMQQLMGNGMFQQQRLLGFNNLMGGGMLQQQLQPQHQQLQPQQQQVQPQQPQQQSSNNDFLGYLQLLASDGNVLMGGGNVGCVGAGGSGEGRNGSRNGIGV